MIEIPPALSGALPEFLIAFSLLFFLYAETHYHFRFAPSLLYRRRPEIIADAPHRLEPGQALPVLLIIKDAHHFPVALRRVHAEIASVASFAPAMPKSSVPASRTALKVELQNKSEDITTPFWWRIYFLELPEEFTGMVAVNVGVNYCCSGRDLSCWNDNHVGTGHAPLRVFRSAWPLPGRPHFQHGDLHFHSDATNDQVEFGAPVEALTVMAQAQGLSFCAVTDHSYDLDDCPDDFLRNDPALRKWRALQERIHTLNQQHSDFVLIPGEEVSCGNAAGGNVHLLVLNHPQFIPGSGDSGEKWLHTQPEHTVQQILDQLHEQALAFAAHPAVPIPFLERKLLNRDRWQAQDFAHPRLNGLQFWNGGARGEEQGQRWWRDALLEGKKLVAVAGNDAHGNFNRFRQIALPCLTMAENGDHVFGRFRTSFKSNKRLDLENVLAALRHGRANITNGLIVDLELVAKTGEVFHPGEAANATAVRVRAQSSPEFGRLERVKIWQGDLNSKQEKVIYECSVFTESYQFEAEAEWPALRETSYIRAEATSQQNSGAEEGAISRALTNPVWRNDMDLQSSLLGRGASSHAFHH